VTTLAALPELKPVAERQVAALEYRPGKAYADFNAQTDRVAAYGLSTLIVGITQPRVGFIPAAHALSTRLMTWLLLGAAVLVAAGLMLFRRKPRPAVAAATPAPFVNTVADAPGSSASKLDLDLDDDAGHRTT